MNKKRKQKKFANKRTKLQVQMDRELIRGYYSQGLSERKITELLNRTSSVRLSRSQIHLDIQVIKQNYERKRNETETSVGSNR